MSTKIITVINKKGGVGKSTTAASLSCNIARLYPSTSVLLIDGDPQSDLTTLLKLQFNEEPITTRDVLMDPAGFLWPSYGITTDGLFSFTPAAAELDFIEEDLQKSGKDIYECVRTRLSLVKQGFVVINCSPSFRKLNMAFVAASDYVIIPTLPEPLSLPEVARTVSVVRQIAEGNKRCRQDLNLRIPQVLGILICIDPDYLISQETKAVLRNTYQDLVFDTTIKRTVLVLNEVLRGMLKDPLAKNTAAANYLDFTKEVISRIETLEQEKNGK